MAESPDNRGDRLESLMEPLEQQIAENARTIAENARNIAESIPVSYRRVLRLYKLR